MENTSLSPLVLLSAISSRIVQLQSTRYTEQSQNLQVPETYKNNARFLKITELSFQFLMEKTLSGESGFFSLDLIFKDLKLLIPNLTISELKLVMKFIGSDCEYHYLDDDNKAVSTRSLTRLIEYQARSERVKLTEPGRLFHRVARMQRDWLFEDKEVAKIHRAINTSEFSLIPDLVMDILITFKTHSEDITRIKENASYDEIAQNYSEKRERYAETLKLSLKELNKCQDRLDSADTRNSLLTLQERNPDTHINLFYLKRLLGEITAALESLSRNFTSLILLIQNDKTKRLGVLNFKDVVSNLITSNISDTSLQNFINDGFGWSPKSEWFSSLDLEEKLEIIEEEPISSVVDYENSNIKGKVESWIKTNQEYLLDTLKYGPKSIVDLVKETEQNGLLSEINQVSELFSLTVSPMQISNSLKVKFSASLDKDSTELINHSLTISRIELSLME